MAVNLTGMASGLDTDSIIQQLMQVDSQRTTIVTNRQSQVKQHQTLLTAVKTKVDALKTAAAALSDATTWKASQTTGSSDPTRVDATLLSGAGIGGHSVSVSKLASSAQHGYAFTPDASAGAITLYYGTDPAAAKASKVTINVPANATAADIATAVNANESSPVYAAVVNDGTNDRLVFSARKTGASSDFTVDTSGLQAGQLAEDTAYQHVGTSLNASYTLDDETTPRTSESNTIESAIPGVRLTLKGITTSPASITTTPAAIDTAAVTKKVQAFVDAYNAVVTTTRADLNEKSVPKAKTSADLVAGRLFGDMGLDSMLSQLKNQMTRTVSGLGLTSLADIGVTIPKATGAASTDDAKDGKLVFDSSKLSTALAADWTKVRDLFSGKGTTKGISGLVSSYVDSQTGSSGILTGRISSDTKAISSYDDQVSRMNDQMQAEQARLKAQFTAMETAMAQSQSQQAWLTSQISSLPRL
jgi:flagellar hook-associated protein 2